MNNLNKTPTTLLINFLSDIYGAPWTHGAKTTSKILHIKVLNVLYLVNHRELEWYNTINNTDSQYMEDTANKYQVLFPKSVLSLENYRRIAETRMFTSIYYIIGHQYQYHFTTYNTRTITYNITRSYLIHYTLFLRYKFIYIYYYYIQISWSINKTFVYNIF